MKCRELSLWLGGAEGGPREGTRLGEREGLGEGKVGRLGKRGRGWASITLVINQAKQLCTRWVRSHQVHGTNVGYSSHARRLRGRANSVGSHNPPFTKRSASLAYDVYDQPLFTI